MLGILCTALSHYLMVASLKTLERAAPALSSPWSRLRHGVRCLVVWALSLAAHGAGGVLMIGAIVWSGLRQRGEKKKLASQKAS